MSKNEIIEKLIASGGIRSTFWGELEGELTKEQVDAEIKGLGETQLTTDLWVELDTILKVFETP